MFFAALTGCKKYEYNANFTGPGDITGTETVTIDLVNGSNIILGWAAGEAEDGSVVLYDVVFDRSGGDFSNPFNITKSDLGTRPQLTLTHSKLNEIARDAGIDPTKTGTFIWTVRASKGGVMKYSPQSKNMTVTRPDALDMPEKLYIFGTALAAADNGSEMKKVGDGIFLSNITFAQAGNIYFCSLPDPEAAKAIRYYYDTGASKLQQGVGATTVGPIGELMDVTVNFKARECTMDEHFDAPDELYIQGAAAEAGQHFRKEADDVFVLYTKFAAAGNVYFSTKKNPLDEDSKSYYVDGSKLELGTGTTAVTVTQYTADRITINTTARTMTVEPIGDIILEWVNAMVPVDAAHPTFSYSSDGNFTLTFNLPADFQHVDEENKGGNAFVDARYTLKVNEDPATPMPTNDQIKATAAADRKIKRWGCKYLYDLDYNMTIQPYDRNHTSGVTHAAYWIPVFETGKLDGEDVDTEQIVITPYYVYSEMPARWKANWFFHTDWAGTTKTATIYTNKNNVMGIHIE